MNRPEGGSSRTPSSKMRNLLTDGNSTNNYSSPVTPPPTPKPSVTPAAVVATRRRSFVEKYWLPLLMVIVLLIGVGLITFSVGMNRGRDQANAQRDSFYIDRYRAWTGEATVKAVNPAAPGVETVSGVSANTFVFSGGLLGRVDKIEGDKVTVLLLDKNGGATGSNLVATLVPATKIWRSVPDQSADMRPGDSILLSGVRNESGNYEARSILILPPNS